MTTPPPTSPHDDDPDEDVVDAELIDDDLDDGTARDPHGETPWKSPADVDPMERTCGPNAHVVADEVTSDCCAACGRSRCTARSKRSNRRCQRDPAVGGRVCASHGAKSPQTAKAIERRRVDAEARALLDRTLWRADAAPITDSASALMLMAGRLDQAVDVLAQDVETTRKDGGLADPVATLAWMRATEQLRKLLTDMQRLGIAAQVVELEAGKVRLVELGITALLDHLELDGEAREAALGVLFAAMQTAATREAEAGDPLADTRGGGPLE